MMMKPTTTKLELKALAAAFRSAARNGHDFGFVEDVVKALRPMTPQAVGALLTSLSKKDVLRVWEPVTTDSGTFTQFTWAEGVDLDYIEQHIARSEGMHPMTRICQDQTPRGAPSVQKIAAAKTDALIADLRKFRAAQGHPESSAALRREVQNYIRPIEQELRSRERDLRKLVAAIAKVL